MKIFKEEFFDYRERRIFKLFCFICNSGEDENVIALFNGEGPLSRLWGSRNFYTVWHRFPKRFH